MPFFLGFVQSSTGDRALAICLCLATVGSVSTSIFIFGKGNISMLKASSQSERKKGLTKSESRFNLVHAWWRENVAQIEVQPRPAVWRLDLVQFEEKPSPICGST